MRISKTVTYLAVPILIILVGIIVYYLGIFNKLLFPNPIQVLIEFFTLFSNRSIFSDFSLTFIRVILSVLISVLIGVPLGLILGYFNKLYVMSEFIIDFFRSVPVTALFPLFMLFFGIGTISKIVLSIWATSLIIIVNTSYGVKHSTKAYLRMAKIYNTSRKYLFTGIIFPSALPYIFSGARIGTSIALVVIIVAEMFVGSVNGLGHAILNAQLMYKIPQMYAIILLTGIFGFLMNKLLLTIEKKTLHWSGK